MTPKFIIEEPANSDELDGHARVARALAEAIKSEKRLRYLGILGRWGSGKSTVVRMLEGQLREEDQTWLFFTYDAWAHQSDPPRRSFLERLKLFIESNILGAKEDESNAEWRRDIDRLAESSETNTTKTTPELTSAAK